MAKSTPSYHDLQQELDAILSELQGEKLDVDQTLAKYKRGLEIIALLESQLQKAENTITELQAKHPSK